MLFQDRFEAGPLLASRLADLRDPADTVGLALLRGAVPVAIVGYEARSLVVYLPRSKGRTRYFTARLAAQFDAVIDVDQTHVLQPLEITLQWGAAARCWRPIR